MANGSAVPSVRGMNALHFMKAGAQDLARAAFAHKGLSRVPILNALETTGLLRERRNPWSTAVAKPFVSPSEIASQDVQARKLPRKPLFLRIADSGPDSAIIMDISVGGALIRTSQPLSVDDTVSISLPHGPQAEARVTWSNGPLAGCQFVTPISEASVSAALLRSDPVPADTTPLAMAETVYTDAPDPHRLALGVPVILGSSLLLWGMIAGVVALF